MNISSKQMFWIVAIIDFGMTLLLTQSPTIEVAKQDAWISYIISGCAAAMITFVSGKLSLLYPNQTFIEYSQTILGKWLGKLIVIPYFIQWILVMGVILRQSSEFIRMVLFRNTPLIVMIIFLLYLMTFITYRGNIEAIGRCSEIFGPVIIIVTIITLLLSLSNVHLNAILPIFVDSGFKSILTGSLNPLSFLGEASLIMMLIKFNKDPKKGAFYSVLAVGFISIFIMFITIETIMVLGPTLASRLWYPYFEMVRFISLMEFLQNIEIIVAVIWILSIFIKLSTYFFITTYGIAQWLNLKDWRKVIWFAVIILIPIALYFPNIDVASVEFPKKVGMTFLLQFNMVSIPFFLWIVGIIRKKRKEIKNVNH
jgi:spore germination protein KB